LWSSWFGLGAASGASAAPGADPFEPASADAQPVSGRPSFQISDIEKIFQQRLGAKFGPFGATCPEFLARDQTLGR
jgi:hypothetical protein